MNLYAIPSALSFFILAAGSVYLARRKPANTTYRLLAIICFLFCCVELGNFMVLISLAVDIALLWQRFVLTSLIFAFPFVTWLSLVFARDNYREVIKKWAAYLVLLFALAIAFLFFLTDSTLITDAERLYNGYGFVLGPIGRYLFIFLLLSSVIALLNFERTFVSSDNEQKKYIRYAIKGSIIFISAYIILSSLVLLFSYIDSRFTILSSMATSTGIILVVSSIIKHRATDAKVHVGRGAIYSSATLSIIGIYLVFVGVVAKLFFNLGFNLTSFLSFLAAFFVFFVFVLLLFSSSLKQRLKLFVDHSFYKDQYDYRREWANLSERLGSILDMSALIAETKKIVKEVLQVDRVELLLGGQNIDLAQWLLRYGQPVLVKELPRKSLELHEDNKASLKEIEAEVLVSLNAKQKLLGILSLGQKVDRGAFSTEDMELLKIISRQVSVAILNAKLSQELIDSREMEHFHKFSSFLIHDLKNFVSMLSMVVQNAANNFDNPAFRKDSMTTIVNTIFKMNNLMRKLSTLPKNLELKTATININALIEETITEAKIENISMIRLFKVLNHVPQIRIDAEYFTKVILNLILNAIEAMPNGGNLTIETEHEKSIDISNKGYVDITVTDTGCGMPEEFINQRLFKPFQSSKRKGLGIGLYQCKAIIEVHGGTISVKSQEGKGTSFVVKMPVH